MFDPGRINIFSNIRNCVNYIFGFRPYINSQASAGGIPPWLVNTKDVELRSLEPTYTNSWKQFLSELLPIIARNQVSAGGNIVAMQIENGLHKSEAYPDAEQYIELVTSFARDQGLTVPIVSPLGRQLSVVFLYTNSFWASFTVI